MLSHKTMENLKINKNDKMSTQKRRQKSDIKLSRNIKDIIKTRVET